MARHHRTAPAAGCQACAEELDHCHGTLIRHHDGTAECTHHGCAVLDPARHALLAQCSELAECAELAECGCAGQPELELALTG
jgi:hypothetical protein